MGISLSNTSKSKVDLSLDNKISPTWDEMDITWDDANGIWDNAGVKLGLTSKSNISLNLETK